MLHLNLTQASNGKVLVLMASVTPYIIGLCVFGVTIITVLVAVVSRLMNNSTIYVSLINCHNTALYMHVCNCDPGTLGYVSLSGSSYIYWHGHSVDTTFWNTQPGEWVTLSILYVSNTCWQGHPVSSVSKELVDRRKPRSKQCDHSDQLLFLVFSQWLVKPWKRHVFHPDRWPNFIKNCGILIIVLF